MAFTAIVSHQQTELAEAALSAMRASLLALTPGLQVCQDHKPGAGFAGTIRLGQRPCARAGSIQLWMEGEIYDDQYRQERMHISLAEWLLQRYLRWGAAGLQNLNGLYSVLVWDEVQRRVEIVNDRYGVARLYVWQMPGGLVVSTQLHAIKAHPDFKPVLDEAAVSDFLCVDHLLEDRTFLKSVTILPAAAHLTWQAGRLQVERYWRLPTAVADVADEREAVDGFHQLLLQAVRRRADQPVRLLLTGGLDSRLLAAALHRQSIDTAAITLGQPHSFEANTARLVASELGFSHTLIPIPANYVERYAHQIVWRTEGNMNVHAGWILAAEAGTGRAQPGALMSGVGGELISGRYSLAEQPITRREEALEYFCHRKWDFLMPQKLLRPEIYARTQDVSLRAIQRSLHAVPGAPLLHAIEEMSLQTHYRRHATARDVFADSLVADPYYDNDLVDYALSLPTQLRAGGLVLGRTLMDYYPQLAGLAHSASGDRLTDGPREERRRERRQLANRAVRKLTGVQLWRDRSSNIEYNDWLRSASGEFAREMIHNARFLGEYVNQAAARRLLEDHLSGRISAFRPVCALITLEQVMQTYLPLRQSLPEEAAAERWLATPVATS